MQARGWQWLGLSVALLVAAVGCGESVDDIDRTQPHYFTKAMFEGDWYYRQTVVDRPPEYLGFGLFTGIEGALEKVRWKIEEDRLVAYRIHESVPGLDTNETLEGATFKGAPVAAYRILEHFDRIRDFNRTTGEQSNVLVEDSSLRPWYERDFMRVDWASNMLDGPVDLGGFVRLVNFSNPSSHWIRENDAFDPDHMQAREDFLFFTNSFSVSDGGWGCYLNYGTYGCGAVEVKVRHAFSRIDPEEAAQFEPRPYLDSAPVKQAAESFGDTNGNGRFDAAEHFEDTNGNGRRDADEPFVDRDGDGAWTRAEPFDDENRNGVWDAAADVQYVNVSVGPDKATQVQVACTADVLDALGPDIKASDCRPLQFDEFSRFGYFRSERVAYDRIVGGSHDLSRQYYANHHQIWRRTIDAEGETIPKSARSLRPVVYYLNPNFPDDLKATATKLGHDWNNALMEAAMAATGRSRSAIEDQLEGDLGDDPGDDLAVFLDGDELGARALFQVRDNNCSVDGVARYMEENPGLGDVFMTATTIGALNPADFADAKVGDAEVRARLKPGNLERTCSALTYFSRERELSPFTWQQMGDLRFNYIWLINEDQPSGPLGYGPSSADIENGRIISGNAYVYGGALDGYARSAADIVQAMNGDLCGEDGGASGLDCLLDGRSYDAWVKSGTTVADKALEISPEFSAKMRRRMGTNLIEGYREFELPNGKIDRAAMARHMAARVHEPSASDPMSKAFNASANGAAARIEALKEDPTFRARMLSDEMIKLVGPLFGWHPGEDIPPDMEALALDLSIDPNALAARIQARNKFFSDRNVYLAENVDDSVIGQALELRGQDRETVYQTLRNEIFEAVMLHEIGHTVGLRHNFKASFDALNYQDEFWQIRDRHAPDEWVEKRLPEHRYASIMDYGSRFNSDTKGLGKYDYAAIKYVYGGHAEVFESGVRVPGMLSQALEFNDYSTIPDMLGGDIANLTKRKNVPLQTLLDEKRAGVQQNAELLASDPNRAASDYWIDRTVPYFFCSDEYRGDLKCRTWDEGANHTEAVQGAIQNYWNYFFFNSFRRGRDEGAFIQSFFGRQGRLREYLSYPFKFYAFYDAYDIDTREDLLQASLLGMNFIGQVLGTPETGKYCRVAQFNGYYPSNWGYVGAETCNGIDVPWGVGRDLYLDFDEDYQYRLDYIGTYYDKINFFGALVDVSSRFFRVPDVTDDRQFSIGLYQAFEPELVELLRDMMVHQVGYIVPDSSLLHTVVDGEVRPQLLVDPRAADVPRNDTPKIYSGIPYNLFWQSMALAAIYNTNQDDSRTDFSHYINITEKGSGDDRVLDESADIIEFEHPTTGRAYVAQRLEGRFSLSYDLVQLGANYVVNTWEPRRADYLDLRRRQAAANYEAEAGDEDIPELWDDAEVFLQNMVELMDDMRQVHSWVDVEN